jgi:hypothetical protein
MSDLTVVAKRLPQQIAGVGFVALANVGDVDVNSGYDNRVIRFAAFSQHNKQ